VSKIAPTPAEHYASKDRDYNNHGKFNNRHRVFRNGAWIWVYGSGYTAYGNNCYWLTSASATTTTKPEQAATVSSGKPSSLAGAFCSPG
jgi:hypothetical protein